MNPMRNKITHITSSFWTGTGMFFAKNVAYRITGVDRAGGWTDCPDEVTE
jgi:hypothetical protein